MTARRRNSRRRWLAAGLLGAGLAAALVLATLPSARAATLLLYPTGTDARFDTIAWSTVGGGTSPDATVLRAYDATGYAVCTSVTPAARGLFVTLDSPGAVAGPIRGVTINVWARGGNQSGTIRIGFSGSSASSPTIESTDLTAPAGGYPAANAPLAWTSTTNPLGGAWTWSDMQNLRAFVRMTTKPGGNPKEVRVTQIQVVVDYDSPITVGRGGDNLPTGSRPNSMVYVAPNTQRVVDEATLTAGSDATTVTAITVRGLDTNGTLQTDVSGVSLFKDNGDGVFQASTDTQLGTVRAFSSQSSGSTATPSGFSLPIPVGNTVAVWVVYTLGASAIDGHIVGSQINGSSGSGTNGTDVTLASGAVTAFSNLISAGSVAGQTLRIDSAAPIVAITSPTSSSTATGTTKTITGTASDSGSGLASVRLSILRSDGQYWGGSTWSGSTQVWLTPTGTSSWSYPWALDAGQNGTPYTYRIDARAVDSVVQTGTATPVTGVKVDNVAPATTLSTTPSTADGENGWFKTTPIIALAASESGATFYSTVSAAGPWNPYVSSFAGSEGATTYYLYSVDSYGNIETVKSTAVSVDTTRPAITVSGVTNGAVYATAVNPTFSATDLHLASVAATLDGAAFASGTAVGIEGAHTLTVRAVDTAGNVATQSVGFTIDSTRPAITVSGVTDGATYAATVTPTFSATDLHLASVVATLDGTAFASGTAVGIEGAHTLTVRAVDTAGNVATQSVSFTIDSTRPVITISGVTDGAVYATAVSPTFSATDAHLASCVATLDGTAFTSGDTVSAGGTHTLTVRATDTAGNVATATVGFAIDTVPPAVTVGGVSDRGMYGAAVSPTFSATDAHLASCVATLDGAPFVSGSSVSDDGTHTLDVRATDAAGNVSVARVSFAIDTIAPIITIAGVTDAGAYATAVSPTFSASDAHLASCVATLDGTAFTSGSTVSDSGNHALAVRATDAAGNVSIATVTFAIDTTKPVITVSGVTDGAVYSHAVSPTFSATDADLASCVATLDGVPFASGSSVATEGPHVLDVRATDVAGNVSIATVTFAIDTTKPVITVSGVIDGGVYNTAVSPTFSASDANPASCVATLDGEAFTSGSSVSGNGTHTLDVRAADAGGNVTTATVAFTIDRVPPVITVSGVTDGAVFGHAVSPTFSAADADLASCVATLDGVPFTSGSSVPTEGAHILDVRATDVAGNVSKETVTFAIDTIAPVITISGVTDGGVYNAAVSPTFSARDANPASCVATLDGAPFTSGSSVSDNGAHTLDVRATDAAGNVSIASAGFTIDTVGPTVTWTNPSANDLTFVDPTIATLAGTATDAGSDVASVFISVRRSSDGLWWSGTTWASIPATLPAEGSNGWSYPWTLQPSSQDGADTYALEARGIDSLGNIGAVSTRTGTRVDNTGPRVVSAVAPDETHVDVTFTESLATTSSLVSAFTFNNGLAASSATLDSDQKTVHLVTSAQSMGVSYQVTVTLGALDDLVGNSSASPNSAFFLSGDTVGLVVSQGSDVGRPHARYFSSLGATCVVDQIVVTASGGASTVNTLTVRGLDSAESLRSDVAGVALYRDNDNGVFEAGDTLLGTVQLFSADASGTAVTFTALDSVVVTGSPAAFWIVYGIAQTAADGHAVGSSVRAGDVEAVPGTVQAFAPITSAADGKTVGFDFSPPSTTASGVPIDWSSTNATVSLSAVDAFSGVAVTYAAVNGGNRVAYTTPLVISDEGTTTLRYWSQDSASNVESASSSVIRIDKTMPSTPGTPTASPVATGSMSLSWPAAADALSGISYYEVLVDHSVATTSTSTTATVSGLATETAYAFSVVAVDAAGNRSAESAPVSAITLASRARPSSAVYARAVGSLGVFVNWTESTGTVPPVSYRVYRSVAGGPLSAIATVPPGAAMSYQDALAPAFVPLVYAVAVSDGRGEGSPSSPAPLTTVANDVLPPPKSIRARNTNSVLVTWTPSPLPSVVGYHVYRSTSSTGVPERQTVAPVTEASYHDTSTASYTRYWYRVASVDSSGNVGTPSRPVYIRTEASGTVNAPHGAYATESDLCALCHTSHTSFSEQTLQNRVNPSIPTTASALLRGTDTIDAPLCFSCHDGTSASDIRSEYSGSGRTSEHRLKDGLNSSTLVCASCHAVHSAGDTDTVKGLLLAGDSKSGNAYCYECHGTAGAKPRGDLRVFERSTHSTGVAAPVTGTKVVCLSCHVSHSARESALFPYSGDDRCLSCHTGGAFADGAADIDLRLSGPGPDTRHDLLASDSAATGSVLDCANCHEPHTASVATPCVDPDNPTTSGSMSASGTALCLRCHDGTLPASAVTSGWAPAPRAPGGSTTTTDIATAWTTNFHGGAASPDPHLKPEMGYAAGDTLTCVTCHDAHGSQNRFALLESVRAKTGTPTVNAILIVPLDSGGADLRFFCATCHDVSPATHPPVSAGGADLSAFPIDCATSGCHRHVGNGL